MPDFRAAARRTSVVMSLVLAVLTAGGVLAWSASLRVDYTWHLPAGIPAPNVPHDNPMSEAKVELGRRLFYDRRLSVNGTLSCGDCHNQALAFTDGKARAVGATGDVHPRSSMTLANVAYLSRLGWANPLLDKLETQVPIPMFGEEPVEMGLAGRQDEVLSLIATDPVYRPAFREAFNGAFPYALENVVKAIAAFERTLISLDSPYDRYLRGDQAALSPAAKRGMALFYSERLECFHCHGGLDFSDATAHRGQSVAPGKFHNTGLYNVDGEGGYPRPNTGAADVTRDTADMGRFRVPTLRNIAVTAPYMHDGSVATLEDVIDHYAAGAGPPWARPVPTRSRAPSFPDSSSKKLRGAIS